MLAISTLTPDSINLKYGTDSSERNNPVAFPLVSLALFNTPWLVAIIRALLSFNAKNYISSKNVLFYFVKISILSFIMIFVLYLFQIMTDYNSGIIYLSIFTSIGILFYTFITYITKQIPNELFARLKL